MEVSGGNKIHMQGRSIAAINIKCRAKSRCRGLFSLALSLSLCCALGLDARARGSSAHSLARLQIHMHELMKQVAFGAGNESRQRAARIHYNRICVRILCALSHIPWRKKQAGRLAQRPAAPDSSSSRAQLWSLAKQNTRNLRFLGAQTHQALKTPASWGTLRFVSGQAKCDKGSPKFENGWKEYTNCKIFAIAFIICISLAH